MHKKIGYICILLLILFSTINVSASKNDYENKKSIKIMLNNKSLDFGEKIIKENKGTLIDAKTIFTKLGYDVYFKEDNQILEANKEYEAIIIDYKNKECLNRVDFGRKIFKFNTFKNPPILINNEPYISDEFLKLTLGMNVKVHNDNLYMESLDYKMNEVQKIEYKVDNFIKNNARAEDILEYMLINKKYIKSNEIRERIGNKLIRYNKNNIDKLQSVLYQTSKKNIKSMQVKHNFISEINNLNQIYNYEDLLSYDYKFITNEEELISLLSSIYHSGFKVDVYKNDFTIYINYDFLNKAYKN